MIAGSHSAPAPILVLGLGNPLLHDDGVGLRMLEQLRHENGGQEYEFVDGGTQGIALLGYFEGRASAVILDAVALGAIPGTVHVLRAEGLGPARSITAHEGNALQLLALARLLGQLPEDLMIVGIEPGQVSTGIGLSERVTAALPEALARTRELLEQTARRGRYVSGGAGQNH